MISEKSVHLKIYCGFMCALGGLRFRSKGFLGSFNPTNMNLMGLNRCTFQGAFSVHEGLKQEL